MKDESEIKNEMREVFDYVGTTLSVMENSTSFSEDISEFAILSHIQAELQGIYDTLGYLISKR